MSYHLWTEHSDLECSMDVAIGATSRFGEAKHYRKRLEKLLGKPVWITDTRGQKIPDVGKLKDDYQVTFERVPFPSGRFDHEYKVEILRRAIVVYEDGTRVPDVRLPMIPQTAWTLGLDGDPLSSTEDPNLMASINAHYRQALID